jgi:hypothetical protein
MPFDDYDTSYALNHQMQSALTQAQNRLLQQRPTYNQMPQGINTTEFMDYIQPAARYGITEIIVNSRTYAHFVELYGSAACQGKPYLTFSTAYGRITIRPELPKGEDFDRYMETIDEKCP